jgi:hypothetical protein
LLLRSYAHSKFAVLREPLVGYRQDALSVKKSLVARFFLARAIARVAWRDHDYAAGAAAVALQAAKFAADAFAISSGLSRRLLSHQAAPFTETEAARWRDVWRGCHPVLDPPCAA